MTDASLIIFSNRLLFVNFHNLKGYDSHLISKQAFETKSKLGIRKIDAIPHSCNNCMTFSICVLKSIDSFQLVASSLEPLVEDLYDPSGDKFKHVTFMQQNYPEHI